VIDATLSGYGAAAPKDCTITNVGCIKDKFLSGLGDAVGKVGSGVVDEVAKSFAKASIEILKVMMTWWVRVPSPGISDNKDDPVYFMHQYTGWLVTWVAVLGVLLAAGRMAWQRRGEPFREALSGLATMIVVVGCGVAAVNLAVKAGDEYSVWILNASTKGDVKGNLVKAGALYTAGLLPAMPAVILIVALLAILSSVVQLMMMVVRSAMLVLLAGALPLAAATAITPQGRQWLRKMIGWLIAFVLYKPVAATIYAVAFRAMMGDDTMSQLQGIILIILAVVALPALMRFTVPMVSAVGGGGGAMAGAMGAGAMGARMIPGGGGRGGGSGGGSGSGSGGKKERGPAGAQTAGKGKSGSGDSAPKPTGQSGAKGGAGDGQVGSGAAKAGSGAASGGAAGGGAAGGGAAGGGAAAGAASAGAAASGVGAAAVVAKGVYDKGKQVAKDTAAEATGDEGGPSGST
jgi:type IV secretion system protein TrbL